MGAIDQLPIPEWGLNCPHCGTSLAGLTAHRCGRCGKPFKIWQLLAEHRPIPELGLECPNCGYSLTGLTGSRCPECGVVFSLQTMLGEEVGVFEALALPTWADPPDAHLAQRHPTFTGQERPLPDFGLICARCQHPLAGATDDRCPSCGERFEPTDFTGKRDWVRINRFVPRSLAPTIRTVLYDNQIPYLVDNARLIVVYGGRIPFAGGGIRVPREFFFDAMYAIAQSQEPAAEYAVEAWSCPSCGERVPSGFELCWNCGGPHPLAER